MPQSSQPMAGPPPCLWALEQGLQTLQCLVGGRQAAQDI